MSREYAGKGTAYYPNNDIYEGDFLDGIRDGRGKYFYAANGDKYNGEWRQNYKHGIGKMVYNGRHGEMKIYGQWKQSKVVHGKWIYPNGTFCEGGFANN
jgi:radial spoke head protein 1